MTLYITYGSWGEIAPLLEICLQSGGEFLTTPDWAPRVREYGVTCHELPKHEPHEDTLDGFLASHTLGRQKAIYELIEGIKPTSIVSAFYCFPAQAYAEKHKRPFLATTTSPYYFMQTEMAASFAECMVEYMGLRKEIGLSDEPTRPFRLAGVYPWYLHDDVGPYPVGWPELRALKPLSQEVAEFIKSPYGVVSRGTLVGPGELDRMCNAIRAHGLKALYLGPHKCNADLSVFLDNHAEAVKRAKVAITHAGIGTTVDCMGVPMVVEPVGYDQFYNANRLVALKCAVGVKDSYINAITEAMKPRSFLHNEFSLSAFLGLLHEHTPREPCRSPADAGECAQVH